MKNTDPKAQFRRTKEWKDFRAKIKKNQKKDPITDKPLTKNYNLHHLDLDSNHYTDISNETHFIGLNNQTHDVVHFFFGDGRVKKDWRKRVEKLVEILEIMEELNDNSEVQ